MTRSMIYAFARYFDADGHELPIPRGPDQTRPLAQALLQGPVFCRLDRVPEDIRARLPQVQPNASIVFDRLGIDPYADRFEITLHGEGTVRGIGGLEIAGHDCRTTVPGLFAAGDAATRELVAGATSGGGAQNSAWALSSGRWAGRGAAELARRRPAGAVARPAGMVGFQPHAATRPVDLASVIGTVQDEMHPYDKNIFRSGPRLARSLARLDRAWTELRDHLQLGEGRAALKARETAALVQTARWCVTAALARDESRGMHSREDRPERDPRFERRLRTGGLDHPWTERPPALDNDRTLELAS